MDLNGKALAKLKARARTWAGRFAAAVNVEASSLGSYIDDGSDEPHEEGFVVLNGGIVAGCSPYELKQLLLEQCLLPQAEEPNTRHIYFSSVLPFAIVRYALQRDAHALTEVSLENVALHLVPRVSDGTSSASTTRRSSASAAPCFTGHIYVMALPPKQHLFNSGSSTASTSRHLMLLPVRHVDRVIGHLQSILQRPVLGAGVGSAPAPSPPASDPRRLSCVAVQEIPGLFTVANFITEDEHQHIWDEIAGHRDELNVQFLSRRRVAHFNRRFIYGVNQLGAVGEDVNPNPSFYTWMVERLQNHDPHVMMEGYPALAEAQCCDQLTINFYDYGEGSTTTGIATHVDAHSPFEDCVLIVSLGSYTVMEFCPWNAPAEVAPPHGVLLEPRSLVIMTGAARYAWTHCIAERHTDNLNDGCPTRHRGDRVSLTWRRGRSLAHHKADCQFPALCDGA